MRRKKESEKDYAHKHTHEESHELLFIRIGCLFFDLKLYATFIWRFRVLSTIHCLSLSLSLHILLLFLRTCAYLYQQSKSKKTLKCIFFSVEFFSVFLCVIIGKSQSPRIENIGRLQMEKERCHDLTAWAILTLFHFIRSITIRWTNWRTFINFQIRWCVFTKWYRSTYNWLTFNMIDWTNKFYFIKIAIRLLFKAD